MNNCNSNYYNSCTNKPICDNKKIFKLKNNNNNNFNEIAKKLSLSRCLLPCDVDYYVSCCLNNSYKIINANNINELANYGKLYKINNSSYEFISNHNQKKYLIKQSTFSEINEINPENIQYLIYTECSGNGKLYVVQAGQGA